MALIDILRTGVAIADAQTSSVQVTVQHRRYTSQSGFGEETFDTATPRQAILDLEDKMLHLGDGRLVEAVGELTLFDVENAVDVKDTFTLPDGRIVKPVAVNSGVIDPGTNKPLVITVILGRGNQ